MAGGLALPVAVQQGRAAIVQGEAQLKKVIFLALMPCPSANPFQDLGLEPDLVFSINDEATEALVNRRIDDAFRRFEAEGRARLADGYPQFSIDSATQELIADIKYVNLETTSEEELSVAFDAGGSGRLVSGS
jgi:hypothetical protein